MTWVGGPVGSQGLHASLDRGRSHAAVGEMSTVPAARSHEHKEDTMKLGTSLRFLYPTGPQTYEQFKVALAALPPGGFIERPMGAFETAAQVRNVLEVAAAAHAAGLDSLLFGDNHAVPASYANTFAPVPTVARLMAVTGTMPVGMVLLAPFYQPIVLAEQLGTLAAFAQAPLLVTLTNGGRSQTFEAFGISMRSRARRLEELTVVLRGLLAGERVTFHGRYLTLEGVRISPLPRGPVELWLAGTVPAAAARAGRLGDGWLTGQNTPEALRLPLNPGECGSASFLWRHSIP